MSSAGLPSRGWAGPRAGTFAPRRRSGLARAFAKGGVARSWDWPLIFVTCGLTVLGTVLVWAATEPALPEPTPASANGAPGNGASGTGGGQ